MTGTTLEAIVLAFAAEGRNPRRLLDTAGSAAAEPSARIPKTQTTH